MRTRRRVLISLLTTACAAVPSFAETSATLRLGTIASGAPLTADSATRQSSGRRPRRPRLCAGSQSRL